jgi:predicted MFS family arabinose efflux permease
MYAKGSNGVNYNKLVLILGLAGFISAADNWFVSPVLPAIAAGFAASVAKTGVILTAYMIPYGVMQPVYGFFSDLRSKTRLLQFIVFGLALGTAGCALSISLLMLCAFRAITGLFAAGIIAVSLAFIGDTVPDTRRQVYVGRFMGIVFLGQGVSAGLGGLFAKYLSWRIAFLFFFVSAIVSVLLLCKLPESVATSQRSHFFAEFKFAITTQKGKFIFPLATAAGFFLLGLYSYLGSYLHEAVGLNYLQVGLIVMFYGFACLVAGTRVGEFGQLFGRFGTILMGGFFAISSACLLAFFNGWQAGLLATISLGFGYIFIQSTLATIAFDVSPQCTGLSSGLVGLGLFGGGGIGAAFSGLVLSHTGYKDLWILLAAGIVLFIIAPIKLYYTRSKEYDIT